MKIFVKPRKFFENIKGTDEERKIVENCNIISINTPEYKPHNFKQQFPPFSKKFLNRKNICVLKFHDATQSGDGVILMSDDDVNKLFDFITKIDRTKDIYVHCTAGKSRSQAVGLVLNIYFNRILHKNDEDYFWYENENKDKRIPNYYVQEKFLEKILKST